MSTTSDDIAAIDHLQMQIDSFVRTLETNLWILRSQSDGLTHEDSVLQLPFRGNCLNWVIGHIAGRRDSMLRILGETPLLTEAEARLYETGSEPITNGDEAVRIERLLECLNRGIDRIKAAVETTSHEDFLKPYDDKMTILQRLQGLAWHETYHVGQTEVLRQLAGKDDKVI